MASDADRALSAEREPTPLDDLTEDEDINRDAEEDDDYEPEEEAGSQEVEDEVGVWASDRFACACPGPLAPLTPNPGVRRKILRMRKGLQSRAPRRSACDRSSCARRL